MCRSTYLKIHLAIVKPVTGGRRRADVAFAHEPPAPGPRFAPAVLPGRAHRQHQPGRRAGDMALAAASKRISDLEAAVGAPLLARHSRGVTPTGGGPGGAAPCAAHPQRRRPSRGRSLRPCAGIVGVVRLAANTSAITQFLPADIAAFMALHPGIRIELEEQNSSDVVMAVLDGRADVGIFADRTPGPGCRWRRTGATGSCSWCRAAIRSRRRGARLRRGDRIRFRHALAAPRSRSGCRARRPAGKRLKLRIQVRSFDAMCQMVAAGLGIAVLPDGAVEPHLRQAAGAHRSRRRLGPSRPAARCARPEGAAAPGAPARRSPRRHGRFQGGLIASTAAAVDCAWAGVVACAGPSSPSRPAKAADAQSGCRQNPGASQNRHPHHDDHHASDTRRAARPPRRRDGPADRRPVRRQDARRLRRRGDQDRAARRRRPAAQLAPAPGRHLRLVAGAVAQQALDRARPAQRRGPGHRAPADRRGRRADRELPPRHARGLGHGLGRAVARSTPAW